MPLSAGIAYEENPTISYVPLDSKKYISRLLSSVPVEPVVLLAGLERDSAKVLELTVERIGTLRNPIYGGDEDRAAFRGAARGRADPTVSAERMRGILLDTRSLVEVLEVAAACIDVPAEHRAARLVDPQLEDIVPPKDLLRIRSSEDRPDDAYVAVSHHGAWFYIPADDGQSKFGFRIVVALLSMQLNESAGQAGPLLTIPVGGGG